MAACALACVQLWPRSAASVLTARTGVAAVRARRGAREGELPLVVVAPGDLPGRERAGRLLAEDAVGEGKSYVDSLVQVHAAVQARQAEAVRAAASTGWLG